MSDTKGQLVGRLVGHLTVVFGALLCIWAVGRFVIIGNAPNDAVTTVLFMFWGSVLQSCGKIICWFAGEPFGG